MRPPQPSGPIGPSAASGRFAAALAGLALVAGCRSGPSWPPSGGSWVDLTYPFSKETIYWPTASGFEFKVDSKGMNPKGYWYEANSFSTAEHGGTHVDAPVHFAKGGDTVDVLPLHRLLGPAAVVDVTAAVDADRDYEVTTADLQAFESRHGRIPAGAIVLLRTGFGDHWPDRVRYLGTDATGPAATLALHFPGLHPGAATWLVEQRKIAAIGIDTASIDKGQSSMFYSHRVLFKAGIPAFENVANLGSLPPTGAFVVALPMKIAGGSGGPLRIIARLPR